MKRSPSTSPTAERALLDYLQRPGYKPLAQRQLFHRLHVPAEERPRFRELIARLLEQGRIVKGRGGRLAVAPPRGTVRGTLQRHRDGFAFVLPEEGGEDIFIPPHALHGGLTGDQVAARVTGRGARGRLVGAIVETLERRSRQLVGVFRARGERVQIEPFEPGLGEPVRVPAAFRHGAGHHDVVRFEIVRDPRPGRAAEGKVLERLGRLHAPGIDALIVSHKYDLRTEVPPEVLEAAEALPARVPPGDKKGRERFHHPPPVTIDGETARDFDDAISVEARPGGGFRLYVHIADVAHFVPPGGVLDEEARERTTSVYFPDRVLPMFPEKLSADLCSLRPGVDRVVHSMVLEIDRHGVTRKARFADGVIRSAARLTYAQAARVLEGQKRVRGVPARVVKMLRDAGRLRERLERRRAARGGVDFDLPVPRILLDVEGAVAGIEIEERNEAHRLIEECMIAANEAVASFLERKGWPCLFRTHDAPDPAKIELLAGFAASLGVDPPDVAKWDDPAEIRALLERAEGRPEYALISQVALRSMRQARYSPENDGHFGLASESYCHFTSPIRRYPDLVVHRLLRACRRGMRPEDALPEETLASIASSCSDRERRAEAAERELLQWKKIAFIRDRVGDRFSGVVTAVTRFGLFVQLTENLVEGLLRVELLGPERFAFDEARQQLRGFDSGTRYRLGDRLEVRVDRVDQILQRVDLSLVAERPAPKPRRRRGRR